AQVAETPGKPVTRLVRLVPGQALRAADVGRPVAVTQRVPAHEARNLQEAVGMSHHGLACLGQNGATGSNFGARFSMCDARPSRGSGPPKPSISNASDASKIGQAWRNQLFSACLVIRTAEGAICDRPIATSSALACNSPSSTHMETRP